MPELDVTEEQLERLEALRAELEGAFVDGYAHVRRRDAVDYLLDTYPPPAERAGEDGDDARPGDEDGTVEERVRAALDREVRDGAGDIDYTALQAVARETDGVKGSGMSAEEMYDAVVEATIGRVEAGETDGVEIPTTDRADETERTDETDGADAGDRDGSGDGTAGSDTSAEGTDSDEAGNADSGDAVDGDAATDGPEGSDPERAGGNGGTEGTSGAGDTASASAGGGGGSQLQQMMNLLETHDDKWRKAESGDAPYEVDLPDGGTEAARTKDDVKRVLFTNY